MVIYFRDILINGSVSCNVNPGNNGNCNGAANMKCNVNSNGNANCGNNK